MWVQWASLLLLSETTCLAAWVIIIVVPSLSQLAEANTKSLPSPTAQLPAQVPHPTPASPTAPARSIASSALIWYILAHSTTLSHLSLFLSSPNRTPQPTYMVIPPPVTDAEPEPDIRSHHNGHTTELHNEQLGAAPANDQGIATGTTGPAEPTTTRDHDFATPQHMTGAPASPPIAPSPAHNNAPSPKVILPVAAHQAPTISTLSDHDGTDDSDDDEHVDPTYWQGFKVGLGCDRVTPLTPRT